MNCVFWIRDSWNQYSISIVLFYFNRQMWALKPDFLFFENIISYIVVWTIFNKNTYFFLFRVHLPKLFAFYLHSGFFYTFCWVSKFNYVDLEVWSLIHLMRICILELSWVFVVVTFLVVECGSWSWTLTLEWWRWGWSSSTSSCNEGE